MNKKNTSDNTHDKKPYKAPKISTKKIYEVNALGCSKCPNVASVSLSIACIRGVKKFS